MLLVALALCTSTARAQDVTFSAKADKTTVNVGDPINLTVTLSGDLTGVELPSVKFPEGFVVAGSSQSTEFSFHGGATERSLSLNYVLIPQQPGTFQLGPFQLKRRDTTVPTEPITITVEKPPLPPRVRPQGERFTL